MWCVYEGRSISTRDRALSEDVYYGMYERHIAKKRCSYFDGDCHNLLHSDAENKSRRKMLVKLCCKEVHNIVDVHILGKYRGRQIQH